MKKCIIRGTNSGVFFGDVNLKKQTNPLTIKNVRKLWYWDGACAVEQLAKDGTTLANNCKFTVTVDSITISDYNQIIPCTKKAIISITGVNEWKK